MITPTRFRNKTTGEIVTQVPILDIANYEEMPSEEAKAIIRPEWDKMQEYITDTEEKKRLDADERMTKLMGKYGYKRTIKN